MKSLTACSLLVLTAASFLAACDDAPTQAPDPVGLQISPSSAALDVDGAQRFTVTQTFSDGTTEDVTERAAFATADETITVHGADVVGAKSGEGRFTVTYDGFSTSAPVHVRGFATTTTLGDPPIGYGYVSGSGPSGNAWLLRNSESGVAPTLYLFDPATNSWDEGAAAPFTYPSGVVDIGDKLLVAFKDTVTAINVGEYTSTSGLTAVKQLASVDDHWVQGGIATSADHRQVVGFVTVLADLDGYPPGSASLARWSRATGWGPLVPLASDVNYAAAAVANDGSVTITYTTVPTGKDKLSDVRLVFMPAGGAPSAPVTIETGLEDPYAYPVTNADGAGVVVIESGKDRAHASVHDLAAGAIAAPVELAPSDATFSGFVVMPNGDLFYEAVTNGDAKTSVFVRHPGAAPTLDVKLPAGGSLSPRYDGVLTVIGEGGAGAVLQRRSTEGVWGDPVEVAAPASTAAIRLGPTSTELDGTILLTWYGDVTFLTAATVYH